jgi:hypothetical protein
MSSATCHVQPLPRTRHHIIDALRVGARRHIVHPILEVDVTRDAGVKEMIRLAVDGCPAPAASAARSNRRRAVVA